MTLEERKRINREYQRKERVKINHPDKTAQEQEKERQRWKKNVTEGKIKWIGERVRVRERKE